MTTIVFDTPKLKKNYYLSNTIKPFTCDIIDAIVKKVTKLQGDKGYILTLYIGKNDQIILDEMDEQSLKSLIENNNKWFSNDLNEDDMRDMFKKSVCEQNQLVNVYLLDYSDIIIDGMKDEMSNIISLLSDRTKTKECMINIKLRHAGMYIYSTHTINKWSVKQMQIYGIEEDDDSIDKEEIETFWKEQLKECEDILENRKKMIDNTYDKLQELYSTVSTMNRPNKEWNMKLSEIKKIIQNIIFL